MLDPYWKYYGKDRYAIYKIPPIITLNFKTEKYYCNLVIGP